MAGNKSITKSLKGVKGCEAIERINRELAQLFEHVYATKRPGSLTLTISAKASGEKFVHVLERLSLTVPKAPRGGSGIEQMSTTLRTRLSEFNEYVAGEE